MIIDFEMIYCTKYLYKLKTSLSALTIAYSVSKVRVKSYPRF
jgi:hypothetical protein